MAKRFNFRLEVVRNLRERARDDAARALAEKMARAGVIERRMESLSQQIRDMVVAGARDRKEPHVEIAALKAQEYHGRWLHGQLAQSMSDLAAARLACDEQRARLVKATAKFKAIEKLRQRRWNRHQFEVRREEQAALDEVAGRFGQRASEEAWGL